MTISAILPVSWPGNAYLTEPGAERNQFAHVIFNFQMFMILAHVSWKLKWPFLNACRPSVNFSHFHLLIQNHWAIFSQTWHKACLGERNSSLFKWVFPRDDNNKILNIHWLNLKIFFRAAGPISTKLGKKLQICLTHTLTSEYCS